MSAEVSALVVDAESAEVLGSASAEVLGSASAVALVVALAGVWVLDLEQQELLQPKHAYIFPIPLQMVYQMLLKRKLLRTNSLHLDARH